MKFHTQFGLFGDLDLIKVIEYYDKPVFVLCKNHCGDLFLAVEIDEGEEEEIWLYAKMTPERWELIKDNIIDLHYAFRLAENNVVYEVHIAYDSKLPATYQMLHALKVQDDRLPQKYEYLDRKHLQETATTFYTFLSR